MAGIKPRDRIIDVNNSGIPDFAFFPDDTHLFGMRKDIDAKLFWDAQNKRSDAAKIGMPLKLSIERDGRTLNLSLIPVSFPFRIALYRVFTTQLLFWAILILTYIIIKKKQNEITITYFIFVSIAVIGNLSGFNLNVRDMAYPDIWLKTFYFINITSSSFYPAAIIHFSIALFPRNRQILYKYPNAIKYLYTISGIIFLIRLFGISDSLILGRALILETFRMLFVAIILSSFFLEKDKAYKKQIQYVVFGFSITYTSRMILVGLPQFLFNAPLIHPNNLLFFPINLLPPVTLYIAVTRYKFIQVEEIIDYAVIYGFTILALFGIEAVFLGSIAPFYMPKVLESPYKGAFLITAIIILLYIPVRNIIKEGAQRIFKRRDYDAQTEIQKFLLSASIKKEDIFDSLFSWTRELLGNSGIYVLKRNGNRLEFVKQEGGYPGEEADRIIKGGDRLTKYFHKNLIAYGYELVEAGLVDKSREIEESVFIPVFVDNEFSYLIVLFKKWNNLAYSKKDMELLTAVSYYISYMLEAEGLKRQRDEIGERFRQQREHVIREMHDGLGSILTNIIYASQIAEKICDEDKDKAREIVGNIKDCAVSAGDFLRTGLQVLDNPEGELRLVISGIRHRMGNLLGAVGINAHFNIGKDVEKLRIGAHANLNIARCIQEAFNNILKHSEAKNVMVNFNTEAEGLKIEIIDDGKGFYSSKETDCCGLGFKNMTKRMKDLGGSFDVQSSPGKETRLIFSLPIKSAGGSMLLSGGKTYIP